jgi:hypothetical protein
MPITGGPYLLGAFFCEKVLQEQDNVLSAIRIVDRWNLSGPTETMTAPAIIQATLVIIFKSGVYRGNAQVTVTPITPHTNTRMQGIVIPVRFEGEDDRGINIVAPTAFPVAEDGVYWFEISLKLQNIPEPRVLTAVPMNVTYQQSGPMLRPQNPAS